MKDNLGSKWLGRCLWSDRSPGSSLIEIQKSVLEPAADARTGRCARDGPPSSLSEADPLRHQLIKLGMRKDGHGKAFWTTPRYQRGDGKRFREHHLRRVATPSRRTRSRSSSWCDLEGNRGWGWPGRSASRLKLSRDRPAKPKTVRKFFR